MPRNLELLGHTRHGTSSAHIHPGVTDSPINGNATLEVAGASTKEDASSPPAAAVAGAVPCCASSGSSSGVVGVVAVVGGGGRLPCVPTRCQMCTDLARPRFCA